MIITKNRERAKPTFANINLLGKCNVDCYFCLGKDLVDVFGKFNHTSIHFSKWDNFEQYLTDCEEAGIKYIYITGQNTDSLIYKYLGELIDYLQDTRGFQVGLRTNGYLANRQYENINKCKRSVGFSIHSMDPTTNHTIMKRQDIPDWKTVIPQCGEKVRIQIVVNRYNQHEVIPIIEYASQFPNVQYVQIRRISTDHRFNELSEDQVIFANLLKETNEKFERVQDFYLAPQYMMFGKRVCWWATVRTSIGSYNFYTDGTINKDYFVIEGYEKGHDFYDPTKDEGNKEIVDPYKMETVGAN